MRAALFIFLLACAGDRRGDGPPPRAGRGLASLAATPAGPGDVVVATVDGRPVYGSCVAAQARETRGDVKAALRACIDFELLAQEAEKRGTMKVTEVEEAVQLALANRLIELDFEATYATPAAMQRELDRLIKVAEQKERMYRPELRASVFIRVPLKKNASPDEVAKAKELADEIYRDLPGDGYIDQHLNTVALHHKRKHPEVMIASMRAATPEGLIPGYKDALYGLKAVGEIAPPVRDDEGWDIVLLTEIIPEKTFTREEVVAQVWPEMRRKQFLRWVEGIAVKSNTVLSVDYKLLEGLDQGGVSDDPSAPKKRGG